VLPAVIFFFRATEKNRGRSKSRTILFIFGDNVKTFFLRSAKERKKSTRKISKKGATRTQKEKIFPPWCNEKRTTSEKKWEKICKEVKNIPLFFPALSIAPPCAQERAERRRMIDGLFDVP